MSCQEPTVDVSAPYRYPVKVSYHDVEIYSVGTMTQPPLEFYTPSMMHNIEMESEVQNHLFMLRVRRPASKISCCVARAYNIWSISICTEDDQFNRRFGRLLALVRLSDKLVRQDKALRRKHRLFADGELAFVDTDEKLADIRWQLRKEAEKQGMAGILGRK